MSTVIQLRDYIEKIFRYTLENIPHAASGIDLLVHYLLGWVNTPTNVIGRHIGGQTL